MPYCTASGAIYQSITICHSALLPVQYMPYCTASRTRTAIQSLGQEKRQEYARVHLAWTRAGYTSS